MYDYNRKPIVSENKVINSFDIFTQLSCIVLLIKVGNGIIRYINYV